jgi:hypothetical protein
MKATLLFPLAAALFLTPGCFFHIDAGSDWDDWNSLHAHRNHRYDGSGNIVSQTREIAAFDRLQVMGGSLHVVVKVGPPQAMSLQGDDALLAFLETRVESGTLVIDLDSQYQPGQTFEIQVGTESLKSVDLSGSANVEVEGVTGTNFDVLLSGSGNISARGSADVLAVQLAGSGNVRMDELHSREAKVSISGSGDVSVDAKEKLAITISGSGSVGYRGSPLLEQHISGSGSVSSR